MPVLTQYEKVVLHARFDSSTTPDRCPPGVTPTVGSGASISTADKKFGAASLYNNTATTAPLQIPHELRLSLGDQDFTVQCWAKWTGGATGYLFIKGGSLTTAHYAIVVNADGSISARVGPEGTSTTPSGVITSAAGAVTTGVWNHYALVKSGTTVYLFLNGVLVGTATMSASMTSNNFTLHIAGGVTSQHFVGYVDEFLIIAQALWTSDFTPPTSTFTSPASDPYWANTAALMHFDGANGSTTFVDDTGLGTVTAGSTAVISNANSLLGGTSLYLDGTANGWVALSNTDNRFDVGAGDFTIEFAFCPTALPASFTPVFSTTGNEIVVRTSATQIDLWVNGAARATTSGLGSSLANGVWVRVAVGRRGSICYILVNGVPVASGTYATAVNAIGSGTAGFNSQSGYIDEFRFTRGRFRYPAAAVGVLRGGYYNFLYGQFPGPLSVSGTVVNGSSNPVANAPVRSYRRSTGELIATTLSGIDGTFSLPAVDGDNYVVALDPLSVTNAQIFDLVQGV